MTQLREKSGFLLRVFDATNFKTAFALGVGQHEQEKERHQRRRSEAAQRHCSQALTATIQKIFPGHWEYVKGNLVE